jgi:hypothetical protein
MITVIRNNDATRCYEHEVLRVDKPAEVVACVLIQPVNPLCVALDLEQMSFTVDQAVSWIQEFQRIYSALARMEKRDGLPPSVAVFGDSLTLNERRNLSEVGALVFDRSFLTANDTKTSAELLARIAASTSPVAISPTAVDQKPLDDRDRRVVNSFPPGVDSDTLDGLIRELNKQAH